MKLVTLGLCGLAAVSLHSNAAPLHLAPQPTQCIKGQFSATGSNYWKTVTLQLTNGCGQAVDFQNASVTFKSTTPINNATFWGTFSPLPFPDNNLVISSSPTQPDGYLAALNLHFPTYQGSTTKLNAGQSIKIVYGIEQDSHVDNSVNVYLNNPVNTGSLVVNNSSAPAGVTQSYALLHLTMNGATVSDIQALWNKTLTIPNLAEGSYDLTADAITNSAGIKYQGTVNPSHFNIAANQSTNTSVTYSATSETGKVCINLSNLPTGLNGYSGTPTAKLTEAGTSNSVSQALQWGNSTTISQLKAASTYNLSTPVINYGGYTCTPTFNPASLVASANASTCSTLSYACQNVAQESVTLNVSGAPSTLTSLNVYLTPNDGSSVVTQKIALTNGSGSITANLVSSLVYNVSTDSVAGYSISFSPQPLAVTPNAVENIVLTQAPAATGGRIITYVPGWKTPPSAQSLASAGYTHVMVAFAVFSTSNPGTLVSAFDTVTKDYIQSLHQAGIKVILSLGGASSSIANTSVDFHQVLSAASSADAFKQTFVTSLTKMINDYQFDGFDIDIEHGINGGGTFTQPQGDIAVLASIINTMHSQNSSLIITLTPQVANISATRGFDQTWGNYASLIGQTYDSLTWVGIQLYNTGCAFGIDLVCYDPNVTSNPNFSVAMATDLLADWPSTVNGQATGFQAYISHLKPSQVVIGYPAPNASGASDGAPVTPTATIKRAIQCLKTATASSTSCGSYIPPKAYGMIGGVFNWEATYDQSNSFKFAKDLKNCVINSTCAYSSIHYALEGA